MVGFRQETELRLSEIHGRRLRFARAPPSCLRLRLGYAMRRRARGRGRFLESANADSTRSLPRRVRRGTVRHR